MRPDTLTFQTSPPMMLGIATSAGGSRSQIIHSEHGEQADTQNPYEDGDIKTHPTDNGVGTYPTDNGVGTKPVTH